MMKKFLVLEVPPSLRGSVEIGSLGGTPTPRVHGCGGISTTKGLCGLSTQEMGSAPKVVDAKPCMNLMI